MLPGKVNESSADVASYTMLAAIVAIPLGYLFVVGYLQQEGELRRVFGQRNVQLFCDKQWPVGESFFCQNGSGLSALSYCVPAALIAWEWPHLVEDAGKDLGTTSPFQSRSVENILFVATCIFLCVGNLAMHGFCLKEGHRLDASSMNCVCSFLGAHAVECIAVSWLKMNSRLAFRVSLGLFYTVCLFLPDGCAVVCGSEVRPASPPLLPCPNLLPEPDAA